MESPSREGSKDKTSDSVIIQDLIGKMSVKSQ
jgi:hypothetical protein